VRFLSKVTKHLLNPQRVRGLQEFELLVETGDTRKMALIEMDHGLHAEDILRGFVSTIAAGALEKMRLQV
jgi:hypothetical protein